MRKLNLREVISTTIAIVMFFFFIYDRYSTKLSVELGYHITIKKGIGDIYLNVKAVNYSHKVEYLKPPIFYFVELKDTLYYYNALNYDFNDFPLRIEYGQELNLKYEIKGSLLKKIKSAYRANRNSEIKVVINNTFGREISSNTFTVENILLDYAGFYDDELYNQISDVPMSQGNIVK